MQSHEEITKINHFLSIILLGVIQTVKEFLQDAGLEEVEEKGCG